MVDTSLSCFKSKLGQGRFRLGIRKNFFAQMVVGHWNRLLREMFAILSLMEFKECLDNTLRHSIFGISWRPGIGLGDHCELLPALDIP